MVVEFFVILLAWLAVGWIMGWLISTILGLPLYFAIPIGIPIGLALLMIYDRIIPYEKREKIPEGITTNNFMPMLLNAGFLLGIVILDFLTLAFTAYIESGGAKMILPISRWTGEFGEFFKKLGIQVTPYTLYGILSTLFFFLGNLFIAHYSLAIWGTLQWIIVKRTQKREITEDICSIIRSLLILIFWSIIIYGVVFPWMAKIAQLQVAKFVWPSEFQPVYYGEEIHTTREISDLNTILQKREGEFKKIIVTGFPWFLLSLHIFAAFSTAIFLLHTQTNLGQIEARHAYVIYRIRERLIQLLRSAIHRFRRPKSIAMQTESSPQIVLNPTSGISSSNGGNGAQPEMSNPETTRFNGEEVSPEDKPVRVMGGGETITPRAARRFPGIYVVEEINDPETGTTSFRIYTRDFYEMMNNHKEVPR